VEERRLCYGAAPPAADSFAHAVQIPEGFAFVALRPAAFERPLIRRSYP
jgi:hypothetical protein